MSKELPYFRFTGSEWLTDDISFETYEVKGLFIDVCSFYWMRDCVVTKEVLEKRFSIASDLLEVCYSIGIIKSNEGDFVEITFLDKQYDILSQKRKKRQKSGKKGGLAKSSNAKAKRKQKPSYKDKDKDNKYEKKFSEFWSEYPKRNGKKLGKPNTLKNFKKLPESELDRVIANAKNYGINNDYAKDPERFLKDDFWKDWDSPQNGVSIVEVEFQKLLKKYSFADMIPQSELTRIGWKPKRLKI